MDRTIGLLVWTDDDAIYYLITDIVNGQYEHGTQPSVYLIQ